MSETSLAGRTAIVTGAGGGLGRAEALGLAAAGANVVVNDYSEAGDAVAKEIVAAGGNAIAVRGDIGEWALGDELVAAAVDTWGSLDIVVNNAGVLRDTMIFNLTESDWDEVIRVHLKGHASLSRAAAVHWRAASKAAGGPIYGRLINTTSEAFLFGSAGQPNYSAAKAGIVALTLSANQGLSRYGVTSNAIAPRARTNMTAHVFAGDPDAERELDILAPERVATLVSYLASPASAEISGQVFIVYGEMVALMDSPKVEQKFTADSGVFSTDELAAKLGSHFTGRSPYQTYAAYSVAELDTTGVENVAN
jgi:3-oxoacyl-[acyl-carrier protein] reductase